MSVAPLTPDVLLEFGRTLALVTSSTIVALLASGVLAYVFLCRRSCRQWNGADRRWERRFS